MVSWFVVVAVVAALAIGGSLGWRPALRATGLWTDGGSPTISPTFFDDPSASASPVAQGEGVQPSAQAAPSGTLPGTGALAKRLDAVSAKGMGTTTGMVLGPATGKVLWQRGATTGLLPASTMKLLTCTAALQALGADATFTTRVVSPAKGRIVLVGSRTATGVAHKSQYSATKAALEAMARSWAAELAPRRVTVNVVAPGPTRTAMAEDPRRAAVPMAMPPLGRLVEPSEVAVLVGFLVAPTGAMVTGQVITMCGGQSLPSRTGAEPGRHPGSGGTPAVPCTGHHGS